MARASGRLVMTGHKDKEYSMAIEFSDGIMPHQLRKEGYYLGQKTCTGMIEVLSKVSGIQATGVSTGVEENKPGISVGDRATASTDELRNVESQCSTKSSKRVTPDTAIDFVEVVPERSQSVASPPLQVRPYMERHRSMGRAPDFLGRNSSDEEGEVEVMEVDEYSVFIDDDDRRNLVSLYVLPLEFENQELVASGGSVRASEASLLGKSGGLNVMRSITAWKLTFPENGSFHILVKIKQTSDAKRWVKLGNPRSGYKETAEGVFCVAEFLAFLKKEPHAAEDRVRNHLLEGGFSATYCNHLCQQRSLLEQYIDLDSALKESNARQALLALSREKVPYAGKRKVLLKSGSSDEDEYPRVKPKKGHTRPDDVSMTEYESEEEFYEDDGTDDEDDEPDDEPGDPLCTFCDDGGYLLCCDGPCMRSFHPRPEDGIQTRCKSLGFQDETGIKELKKDWLCENCRLKKHQCYVCGELGDSDEALGAKRQVFVCDVACCGKFYHPVCIASRLKLSSDERRELERGIQAGEESFTCPLHRCKECGKGEQKKDEDLNLATCRRCPVAWHKKCLPSTLSFDNNEESHLETRAWKVGTGTFIVYCTDHEILKDLGTPRRNHVKFPQSGFRYKLASSTAVSQRHDGSAGTAQPATQPAQSEDDLKSFVHDIVAKSKQKITKDSVEAKLVFPKTYGKKDEPAWMKRGKFDSILNAARAAVEKLNIDKRDEARLKCGQDQLDLIDIEEKKLITFLNPTVHGRRYSSFGRHFTKFEKLRTVVEALEPHIRDGDTIVDFCCGDNTFSQLLHDTLSNTGKTNCRYKNFDIFPPKNTFGFERRDWFNVTKADCGPGDNLVIGLNPPFSDANKFVSHAVSMEPRVLVLIVPSMKTALDLDYACVLDDETTMAGKLFYLPGSVHVENVEYLEEGNSVAPHLYIFVRRTAYGAPNAGPSGTNPSQQIQQTGQSVKPVKPVKPAKPKPPSDPTAHLFLPPDRSRDLRAVRVRTQPMSNRSEAMGPRSQIDKGEILPPPPDQPSIFQDRPHHDAPQSRSGSSFHQPSGFSRPHYSSDEYNPDEPYLFPGGHPGGMSRHDPRGFPPRPGQPSRNIDAPRPRNQHVYGAPPTSRRPVDPRRRHLQGPPLH